MSAEGPSLGVVLFRACVIAAAVAGGTLLFPPGEAGTMVWSAAIAAAAFVAMEVAVRLWRRTR